VRIKRFKRTGLIILICITILSFIDNINFNKNSTVEINEEIRQSFIKELRDNKNYKWSRYDSDKWVKSYKILNVNQLGYKTYDIGVEFLLNNNLGKESTVKDTFKIDIK
jgi:hypothetical protein